MTLISCLRACVPAILVFGSSAPSAQNDALRQQALDRVTAFEAWASGFDPAHSDAAMRARGLVLASERRQAMKLLLVEDPATAIRLALPYTLREKLPAEHAAQLEQRIDGEGLLTELVTMYHDHPPGIAHEEGDFHRSVRTPVVSIGEQRWLAFTHGRRVGVRSLLPLPVHGIAIDGDMAISELPYRLVEAGEPMLASAAQPRTCPAVAGSPSAGQLIVSGGALLIVCADVELQALEQHYALLERDGTDGRFLAPLSETYSTWTTGPKTFLYIRVRFSDQAEALLPNDATANGTITNMRDHMRAFSYSLIPEITHTLTPILVLPETEAYYVTNGDTILLSHARTAAVNANAAWATSNFNFYAVRFRNGPGSYAGQAYVGGTGIWMKSDSGGVAAHELGHNLGLLHANYWNASVYDPAGAGVNSEYGNPFDRLGSGGGLASHFTASFKERLSWLLDPQFARVWGSGSYRVFSHDAAAPASGPGSALMFTRERLWQATLASNQSMPLPVPGIERGYYWLEHRNQYSAFGRSLHTNLQGSANYLLDLTPRSRDGKNDGGLLIGRTLSDPRQGMHVTPIAKNSSTPPAFDVVVHSGAFAGNRPPIVALAASATTVAAGANVTFTATASDPDGDALAYSWQWGDGTFNGTNAASNARSFSSAGHYRVRVVATDMKGGQGSSSVLLSVGSPTTLRASGRVLRGGLPLEGVHVGNGAAGTSYRGTYTDSDGTWMVTGLVAGAVSLTGGIEEHGVVAAFSNPLAISGDMTGLDFNAIQSPTISVAATDDFAVETPADTITFRVTRSGPTTAMQRVWFDRAGTAFSSGTSGDYTFSTGANRFVEMPVGLDFVDLVATPVADALVEPRETIIIDLVDGVDYQVSYPGRAQGAIDGVVGPPNDPFNNAFALSGATVTTNGPNTNATIEFMEPPHNGRLTSGASVWWQWTAPESGSVVIDTVGSTFDTLLAVYSGPGLEQLAPIAANNNAAAGTTTSRVNFAAEAGVIYRIAVASPNTSLSGGAITLNINLDTSAAGLLFRDGFE